MCAGARLFGGEGRRKFKFILLRLKDSIRVDRLVLGGSKYLNLQFKISLFPLAIVVQPAAGRKQDRLVLCTAFSGYCLGSKGYCGLIFRGKTDVLQRFSESIAEWVDTVFERVLFAIVQRVRQSVECWHRSCCANSDPEKKVLINNTTM